MKKMFVISILLFVFTVGTAMAYDQTRDQDRKRDQKKDGSCNVTVTMPDAASMIMAKQGGKRNGAGSGDQRGDRKRDGSCLDNMGSIDASMLLAADQQQDRKKDRKKDGSCNS